MACEMTADVIIPNIVRNIMLRVIYGRLRSISQLRYSRTERYTGSQPSANSKSELVAHDQNPSIKLKENFIFLPSGIFLFFIKLNSTYGTFSTPHPHRRCCL